MLLKNNVKVVPVTVTIIYCKRILLVIDNRSANNVMCSTPGGRFDAIVTKDSQL